MPKDEEPRLTKGQRRAITQQQEAAAAALAKAKSDVGFEEVFTDRLVHNARTLWDREFVSTDQEALEGLVFTILQADVSWPVAAPSGGKYRFVEVDENDIPVAPDVHTALMSAWGDWWVEEPTFKNLVTSVIEAGRRRRYDHMAQDGSLPLTARTKPLFDSLCQALWANKEIRSIFSGMEYLDPRGKILNAELARKLIANVCHHESARAPIDLERAYLLPKDADASKLEGLLGDQADFSFDQITPVFPQLIALGSRREAAIAQLQGLACVCYIHARLISAGLQVQPRIIPNDQATSDAVARFKASGMRGTLVIWRNYIVLGDVDIPLWEYLQIT